MESFRFVRAFSFLLFSFLGLTGAATAVFAQETIHQASIGGRVTDATGGLVPDARVTVRQTDTNQTSTAITGPEGRFRFPYLRVGPYEIEARKPGFATFKQVLTLSAGSSYELPVTLSVAESETSLTVSAQAAVLDAARTQVAGTVPRSEVDRLPLNGRNFLDIALLVPGVSASNIASTQLFAETSAVPGQGISVASQRNFSNSFIVDGLSANDDAAGLTGALFGVDAIQDFQVVTSGGQAEFGRAMGGYVNVVTRSGANSVHGSLYGYFRNQRFNARNALASEKLPMTQAQYGASLSGPIVKDRTFYFGNFEQRILNQSGLVTIAPANVETINTRLKAVGYQGPLIATGIFSNPVRLMNVLGKVDHQFSARDQFSVRFSAYDAFSRNARGAGALSAATASSGLDNTDSTIAASNVYTLSPRLVNETRGQFTRSDLAAEPTDLLGPAVNIAGVASFGRLSNSPTGRLNKLYEIVDNLSYQHGAHALRVGVNFLFNGSTIRFPRTLRGAYSFSSLANFLNGTYNNQGFTQTFGNPIAVQNNPNAGFYAQDEWKLNPRLTLNLGVRYDLQFLKTIAADTNNVSPRVGLAWSPFESRRTVVRGSYGLFYDRVPLRALANALLSAGNTTDLNNLNQTSVSLSPTQTGAPVFPNILSAVVPSVTLVNFSTMDRNMQNAYSQQVSMEVEQQLTRSATVSAGYMYLRGLHLLASLNQNVPACVAAGTNNGCRPNPDYANNSQYSAAGDSRYNALFVSFVQRPSRWGSYRVSYTLSKAQNNVGQFFFSGPIDPFNIWKDWGRSDDDQRHRLMFLGTVESPQAPARDLWERLSHGFQVSTMFQYSSAFPLNITSGVTTLQGTSGRPIVNGEFLPRNSGEGFGLVNLNVRVSRNFHISERMQLQAMAESFNALNHVNGLTKNGNFGPGAYPDNPSAAFGRTTSVADPRTLQLAVRIQF